MYQSEKYIYLCVEKIAIQANAIFGLEHLNIISLEGCEWERLDLSSCLNLGKRIFGDMNHAYNRMPFMDIRSWRYYSCFSFSGKRWTYHCVSIWNTYIYYIMIIILQPNANSWTCAAEDIIVGRLWVLRVGLTIMSQSWTSWTSLCNQATNECLLLICAATYIRVVGFVLWIFELSSCHNLETINFVGKKLLLQANLSFMNLRSWIMYILVVCE